MSAARLGAYIGWPAGKTAWPFLLTVTLLAGLLAPVPPPAYAAEPPPVCPPGRKVIVLAGVLTTGISERFDYVRRLLPGCDVLEYSYDGKYGDAPGRAAQHAEGSPGQSPDDSAERLQELVLAYPDSEFDLVGHSLGGFTASYWAANRATARELRRIHSIITLDSPLQGRPLLSANEQAIANSAPIEIVNDLGQVFTFLEPGSATVQSLRRERLTEKANLVTLRSRQDQVVPADYATLPGLWHDEPFDGSFGDCGWGPHMGAWWWIFKVTNPAEWKRCWLESHSVAWDSTATALTIRRAIAEFYPGYVEYGGDTTVKAQAPRLLAESQAAMRALPELRLHAQTSMFGMSGTGDLTLRGADEITGQGAAAGASWSVVTTRQRAQLRLNGWALDDVPAQGAAEAVRDLLLHLPDLAQDWRLLNGEAGLRLEGTIPAEGLAELCRDANVCAPGAPKSRLLLTLDPVTLLWQEADLRLSWPVVDTTVLGQPVEIGPLAQTTVTFSHANAARPAAASGAPGAFLSRPAGPHAAAEDRRDHPGEQATESAFAVALQAAEGVELLRPVAQSVGVALAVLDLRRVGVMLAEEPRERAALQAARQQFGEDAQEYDDALRRYRVWEYQTPLIGPFLRWIHPLPVSSR